MADGVPPLRLRLVRSSDAVPARRLSRRPGAAVVLILAYAAVFGAGLWWFRSASPLFKSRARKLESSGAKAQVKPRAASPAGGIVDDGIARRASLLAGEGLTLTARKTFERRIAAEKCTCGCELTVQACLARDRSCGRSPEIAEKIRASLR